MEIAQPQIASHVTLINLTNDDYQEEDINGENDIYDRFQMVTLHQSPVFKSSAISAIAKPPSLQLDMIDLSDEPEAIVARRKPRNRDGAEIYSLEDDFVTFDVERKYRRVENAVVRSRLLEGDRETRRIWNKAANAAETVERIRATKNLSKLREKGVLTPAEYDLQLRSANIRGETLQLVFDLDSEYAVCMCNSRFPITSLRSHARSYKHNDFITELGLASCDEMRVRENHVSYQPRNMDACLVCLEEFKSCATCPECQNAICWACWASLHEYRCPMCRVIYNKSVTAIEKFPIAPDMLVAIRCAYSKLAPLYKSSDQVVQVILPPRIFTERVRLAFLDLIHP